MIGVIMTIAIVFDVSEKIEDFLTNDAPLKAILLDYYLNFAIYYGNLLSFLIIFLSVIFFTSKMASNTEIVAILSSGVSFKRLLYPYFIAATILASGSYYLNHWLVPHANKVRLDFEEIYVRNAFRYVDKNIHKQISPGEFIYMERYNNTKNTGYKFAWEKWEGTTMTYKLMADFIVYDTTIKKWSIKNYVERYIDGYNETLNKGKKLDTILALNPDDFQRRMEFVGAMDREQLDIFIDEQTMIGSEDVPFYLIEKHQRTSYPFATYVLTLIGVCIASRKIRGGTGIHLVLGLSLCVTYILALKVTTVYALNAGLDAFWAVWIPNILFAFISLFIYRFAPK